MTWSWLRRRTEPAPVVYLTGSANNWAAPADAPDYTVTRFPLSAAPAPLITDPHWTHLGGAR